MEDEITKCQKEVLDILKDKRYWKPPSSRTIAKILKKSGHMGVEYAINNLKRDGLIDEERKPIIK